ncbi:HD domain-containing phosphohydrolase [Undibacterium sp. Rencai35W]|uniref:HD domain-containing phosphohydrolase n=1 Tax=Undibacterium sp. Rencai35W TaxID=3413046 RepID=UPI003BF5656D
MNAPAHVATFSCPEFLAMERTIIDDFVDCTRECCEEAETCVKALNHEGGADYIHRLFRSLHSLKGNCQMVGLAPFTGLLHRIEEIFARVRSRPESYFSELGEFLLIATDEVEDLLTELINTGQANDKRRQKLYDICDALQKNSGDQLDPQQFKDAITALGGKLADKGSAAKSPKIHLELPADMELMQKLSLQIDNLSIYRKNRSDQVVQLMESLNEALGFPLDTEQLKAASLMHDVGMSFIPHNIFNKEGVLSKEELRFIQEHVVTGSQLLLRFGGWNDAARMVLDHHEKFDGSGYPNGLAGEQIHPGGRMLAIIDTFCSVTTERSDRSYKKSLLSAISEINANIHIQFDPVMVTAFNDVVRKMMMKQ